MLTEKKEVEMSKIQRAKRASLSMILSLIITFLLLIHVNFAKAEEASSIKPNLGFDFSVLSPGQSITFNATQSMAVDVHNVGVISLYNKSLTATLTTTTKGATGFWWITMMGIGGKNWFDLGYGLIGPTGGLTATIDIGKGVSFGLASGGAIITSIGDSGYPFKYSIRVAGSSAL